MVRRAALLLLLTAALPFTAAAKIANVLQPGTSPLISFRILVMTGSAYDPPGKEGLASLTAAMLAQGGSRSMTYDQIVEAMYPMATSVNWQADKEMTTFSGTTHVENLGRYYSLLPASALRISGGCATTPLIS